MPAIEDFLRRSNGSGGQVYNEWCDEEETIVRMVFEGEWSWMECFYALLRIVAIGARRHDTGGIIYDLSASTRIPDGIWAVGKYDWVWQPRYWPTGLRRIVVIGGGPVMDEVFEVRRRVSLKSTFYFKRADTLEEAIELIRNWDQPTPV